MKGLVGASGFEPPASWSQTRRSSQAEPRPETTSVLVARDGRQESNQTRRDLADLRRVQTKESGVNANLGRVHFRGVGDSFTDALRASAPSWCPRTA
jgi:hypothetical protein